MPKIEWNDSLKLGVTEIDKQHEKLIGLINDLYDACTLGKAQDIVDEIVSEAHDYIGYHFSTEQRLMEEHDYPVLDDHIDEHEDYILKSSDYLVASQDNAKGLAQDVLDYLTGWWKTHINDTDRKLALYLKGKGVK
ncbi:MAG: bacteriohemerythrin [Proteobacteria bacterium]|nr:bacteriohemerythrin [Pseudomonadota bacterium]